MAAFGDAYWEGVNAAAVRHGVRPLLYHRLTLAGSGGRVPERVLAPLRERFLLNGLRNEVLYQDLHEVLVRFRQEGLPALLLKGAYLARWVYDNPACRQMADIDLLVREPDLPSRGDAARPGLRLRPPSRRPVRPGGRTPPPHASSSFVCQAGPSEG